MQSLFGDKIVQNQLERNKAIEKNQVQKTIKNSQLVKKDKKLKDIGQVLKDALEYTTGAIDEELKSDLVLIRNA